MDVSVDNEVIVNTNGTVEVAVGNAADAVVADDHALDITVTKKEYKIVGDEVYIAKLYEDAPQWMKDLVQLVVDNTMETESVMLRNDLIGQLNQFATSYVPLNSYTQSIIDLSNADTAMHDTLETLNSNFNDGLDTANSQIIDLQSTKASKTEVATKVIETLTAQLATPTSELGATIGNLQQTIVDGDSANADSVTTLMSVLEGEVDARASAIETISTYVGIDEAGASTSTGLSAYLEGSDGTIGGADSQVANSVAIVGGVPKSKWQYNSALVVNGTTYNSGFGLSNSAGTGIGSEFWIDASRFKFTNSAKTGSTAPFTIDASGATPQITFNGRVSFSNVTGTPTHTSGLLANRPAAPVAGSTYTATDQDNQIYTYTNVGWIAGGDPDALTAADLGASGTTVIDGGRITTGSIAAARIDTNELVVQRVYSPNMTFRLSAFGDVGPVGNTTYNMYGARIYGGKVEGAHMSGGIIESTYLQNSVAFDTFSSYTGCPSYPMGMPILNTLNSSSTGVLVNNNTVAVQVGSGNTFTTSFVSNIFSYNNCTSTVNKLKASLTPVYVVPTLGGIAIRPYFYGTIMYTVPCAAYQNIWSIAFIPWRPGYGTTGSGNSYVGLGGVFSTLDLAVALKGASYTFSHAAIFAAMVLRNSFRGEDVNFDVYTATLPLAGSGLSVCVVFINAWGTLAWVSSVNPSMQAYIVADTTTLPFSAASIGTGDMCTAALSMTVGTVPATYYGGWAVRVTGGAINISVDNT